MPELPEVQTTVTGLSKTIVGKKITSAWSDFHVGTTHGHKPNIKNKKYFKDFKKRVVGAKVKSVERKGKNILIGLNNNETIIVHMKMTGHLMYGQYELRITNQELNKEEWVAVQNGPLQDPFNKFIHFVAALSNGKHLVLSDMRKFASVCIEKTDELEKHEGLSILGPDPLQINAGKFSKRILAKKGPVKGVLMDQAALAGIGNIYSDEILWATGIHPESQTHKIPTVLFSKMFVETKKILRKSIKLGGDSMSDYRNALGEKGGFQNCHKAYRRTGNHCAYPTCRNKRQAIIKRIVVRGRSAHFCPVHQKLYK